jgi:hypothetical protein
MQNKSKLLSFGSKVGLSTLLALGVLAQSLAQTNEPAPNGTWIAKAYGPSGGPDEKIRLILRVHTLPKEFLSVQYTTWCPVGDPMAWAVNDGKATGNEISFTVVNVLSNTTLKYKGTVSGGTIEGTVDIIHSGETKTRNWTAKRETKKK